MAELVEYQLVTPDGVTQKTSKDFNGKAIATYPNGDVYDGVFVNGVSFLMNSIHLFIFTRRFAIVLNTTA